MLSAKLYSADFIIYTNQIKMCYPKKNKNNILAKLNNYSPKNVLKY